MTRTLDLLNAENQTRRSKSPPPPPYSAAEATDVLWRAQLQPLTAGDCALDFVWLVEPHLTVTEHAYAAGMPDAALVPRAFNLCDDGAKTLEAAVAFATRCLVHGARPEAPIVCFAALSTAFGWPTTRPEAFPVVLELAARCRARRMNAMHADENDCIMLAPLAGRAQLAATARAAHAELVDVARRGGDVTDFAYRTVRQPVPLNALRDIRAAAALLYAVDVQLGPVALAHTIVGLSCRSDAPPSY